MGWAGSIVAIVTLSVVQVSTLQNLIFMLPPRATTGRLGCHDMSFSNRASYVTGFY